MDIVAAAAARLPPDVLRLIEAKYRQRVLKPCLAPEAIDLQGTTEYLSANFRPYSVTTYSNYNNSQWKYYVYNEKDSTRVSFYKNISASTCAYWIVMEITHRWWMEPIVQFQIIDFHQDISQRPLAEVRKDLATCAILMCRHGCDLMGKTRVMMRGPKWCKSCKLRDLLHGADDVWTAPSKPWWRFW
jgi:hypothetical protein